MKKLLAVVLGLVMCLSVSMLAACGSAFDGDYKETDASSVSAFAEKVDEAGLESISYESGIKTYIEFKGSSIEGNFNIKNTMYFGLKDNKLAMNGEVASDEMNAKVYYADGYMYFNGKYDNVTAKFKQEMGIEELIGSYGETDSLSQINLSDAIAQYSSENVKFYMATEKGVTKIKLEVKSTYGNVSIYYIFNADNYALQGFKMDMESNFEGFKMKGTMYAESWNGNINLPSDLASYPEGIPFMEDYGPIEK